MDIKNKKEIFPLNSKRETCYEERRK